MKEKKNITGITQTKRVATNSSRFPNKRSERLSIGCLIGMGSADLAGLSPQRGAIESHANKNIAAVTGGDTCEESLPSCFCLGRFPKFGSIFETHFHKTHKTHKTHLRLPSEFPEYCDILTCRPRNDATFLREGVPNGVAYRNTASSV